MSWISWLGPLGWRLSHQPTEVGQAKIDRTPLVRVVLVHCLDRNRVPYASCFKNVTAVATRASECSRPTYSSTSKIPGLTVLPVSATRNG